jgi:putative DNA primase/helicase
MRRDGQLIVGRLQEHGRARYPFGAGDDLSYFLKMLTDRGERTLWGRDLERAIRHSVTGPKTGDLVGARRIDRQAVTVTARRHNVQGDTASPSELHTHRSRWVVEKIKYFAERAQLARRVRDVQEDARRAVRSRPELASTYLSLRGAEEIAERRIADPKDRERFLALVREAMASSVKNGEPLPTVRMRDRLRDQRQSTPAPRVTKRDEGRER